MIAAVVGAGNLGGALVSTLTARESVRDVRLIDEAGTAAAGKALDVLQAAPVLGSTVRTTGHATLDAVAGADVVVVADAFGPPSLEWQGEAGLVLLRRLAQRNTTAPFVLAGASQAWLIEHAVAELGLPRHRLLGSAPSALDAGLRALVGLEAGVSPLDVHIAITGVPPGQLIVGWDGASIAGTDAATRLDRETRRRIDQQLPYLWPPGPIALGAAAARLVDAICRGSHRSHAVFVALDTPVSPARRVVVAGADVDHRGVTRVIVPDLSVQERLALDNVLLR